MMNWKMSREHIEVIENDTHVNGKQLTISREHKNIIEVQIADLNGDKTIEIGEAEFGWMVEKLRDLRDAQSKLNNDD
jgi:hypothetical protein